MVENEQRLRQAARNIKRYLQSMGVNTPTQRTIKMGRSSITKIVEIHGATKDGSDDLRAEVELVSVFVDLDTHRPMPFPEWIKDVFLNFDAKAENAPKLEEVPAE
jgi:acyl-CoA thioesterase FadM